MDDDLSDPVAVALLGMGFTEDQVRSAARALGGFDRATADDMVMWILGGGEIANEGNDDNDGEDELAHNETAINDDTKLGSDASAVLTKAQKKTAARAKRDAEELARKRGEEVAAQHRAAAKREEQRRIRREWNEREQARQKEEKAARGAAAVERRRRTEVERLAPLGGARAMGMGGVLPAAIPTSVAAVPAAASGNKGGKHRGRDQPPGGGNGPPLTIIAGGTNKTPSGKAKAGSNMGIPQAPTVRAPKILARPTGNNNASSKNSKGPGVVHGQPQQPASAVGNQPLFAPVLAPAQPGGKSVVNTSPTRMHAKPYNPPQGHHGHHHQQQQHHNQQQPTAILQKNNHNAGHHPQNMTPNRIHHAHATPPTEFHGHLQHHPLQHASSFGGTQQQQHHASNNGMQSGAHPSAMGGLQFHSNPTSRVSSTGSGGSVPPPGFRPGSAPEAMSNDPSAAAAAAASYVDVNHMGMIRAKAREFVPTSFTPAPTDDPAAVVPSMSAQQQQPNASMSAQPATVSPPPHPTRSSSNEHNQQQRHAAGNTANSNNSSANLLVEPMSSLLSSFGADTGNTPPATMVPMTSSGGNGKDIADSTVPSAASSITGLSGLQNNNAPGANGMAEDGIMTSRVGSVMMFESTSSSAAAAATASGGGIQTSSILESISYGGPGAASEVEDIATGTAPLMGSGAGIWGGANNVNVNLVGSGGVGVSSNHLNAINQPPTLGLAGLNFASFMGEQQQLDERQHLGNNGNNGGAGNLGGGGAIWGASTSGGGSIW